MLRFRFFVLIIFAHVAVFTKSACIIIHGTWARDESWYQPTGDFFKSVARCAQELHIVDEIIPFSWSGKLGYAEQLLAAQSLAKLIGQYESVILIGHSHGVTVGILASQILGKRNHFKIIKFYALGVPVDLTDLIYPDMQVVGRFYNLFSFGDYVQPVNGAHGRCFAHHERVVNIAVKIDQDHPSHGQLHSAIIGKELLKIENYFADRSLGNFETFFCGQPGEIIFHEHDLPEYRVQHDQAALLKLDIKARAMLSMALFRKKVEDDEL